MKKKITTDKLNHVGTVVAACLEIQKCGKGSGLTDEELAIGYRCLASLMKKKMQNPLQENQEKAEDQEFGLFNALAGLVEKEMRKSPVAEPFFRIHSGTLFELEADGIITRDPVTGKFLIEDESEA